MKAVLEFNLPEERSEHESALAGADALSAIDELLGEIRSSLKHDSGYFGKWRDSDGVERSADDATLERVRELVLELKRDRRLPLE